MNTASDLFESLSNGFADAVEAASPATVLVNARRRMPSTGIAYTADLVITANHTLEREDDVKILYAAQFGKSWLGYVAIYCQQR